MSPASGDLPKIRCLLRFHVSIQLMSPASGDLSASFVSAFLSVSFHSINVPSEWGLKELPQGVTEQELIVSIQLMSPASGDLKSSDHLKDLTAY